jgi:hypothetical protein
VVRYENINGQDVNIIDPAKIRAEIARAISGETANTTTTTAAPQPLPPANPQTAITVVNASQTPGLASQAASLLGKHDFTIEDIRDRQSGEPVDTVVTYGPGAHTDAQSVATLLGIDNAPQASSALAADHVRVILGDGWDVPTEQPATEATADSTETTKTNGWSGMTTSPTPDQGKPIDGGGVPCVN